VNNVKAFQRRAETALSICAHASRLDALSKKEKKQSVRIYKKAFPQKEIRVRVKLCASGLLMHGRPKQER
jgi:hypothetical protein